MAVSVELVLTVFTEMSKHLCTYEEVLALIGFCHTSKLAFKAAWTILEAVRVHLLTKFRMKIDMASQFGKWAIVTGSTDGIGKAYAHELARRGINIILVSQNMDRLKKVAKEIENEFSVDTFIIKADFSEGRSVYSKIAKELEGKEIGILVNNVGISYDYPTYFTEVSEDLLWNHINVNIGAVTLMTKMVLPQMIERRQGAIINMASSAAIAPLPLLTVYSATKSYIIYFTQGLQRECKSHGIIIQNLMPFYVSTNMTQFSGMMRSPSLVVPSPATYAHNAISTLGYSDNTTGYWIHGIQYMITSSVPRWIWLNLGYKMQKHFRNEALQQKRS